MTIDKSLKTRAERIGKLVELERWKEGDPVLGLPKTRVVKITLKKKKKTKKAEEEGAEAEPKKTGK